MLRGRVRAAAFLGALARYWIDAAGMEWIVDQPAPGERRYEGEVYLVLDPERTHVLAGENV
ncbi:MAG: TOBE domain-containing protein [Armatimonadota bacterium]|nr:TOBE domain-containing protein [Armatimonadota bacterium]MDR7532688.1 TOBE domain-containing protein [Armatimonadota bacterium]MDR7536339.1 TOBE domain-containing protein [Armatimonadota bacterium]